MNQKDLIKWGVVAALVYFGWRYLQDHGGFNALLGTGTATNTGTHPAVSTVPPAGTTTQPVNTTQQVPVLDFNGLVVARDVNDSLTGTVKINGVPVRLSIITADGRIFDGTGSEVTGALQGQGVDVVALRNAFQSKAPADTGSTLMACSQPNFFSDGVCVSGNTLDGTYGQPVPGTKTQAQQNAGMSGLAGGRWTPYWMV